MNIQELDSLLQLLVSVIAIILSVIALKRKKCPHVDHWSDKCPSQNPPKYPTAITRREPKSWREQYPEDDGGPFA